MEIEGLLLVNKPKGPSSFDLVRKVRKLCGIKRVGHAGTLDPLASGLMLICLGRYTKICGYLSGEDKIYDAVFRLGETSNTDDAEGQISKRGDGLGLDSKTISCAVQKFVGPISQSPPAFSAVKIGGQRAYKIARQNGDVKIEPRLVHIFKFEIIKKVDADLFVRVHCSKGTYIRALARDLGEALGVGAYAKEIKRIKSGRVALDLAHDLDELDQSNISEKLEKNLASFVSLKTVNIDPDEEISLRQGKQPTWDHSHLPSGLFLAQCNDLPCAVLEKCGETVKIVRVI